MTHPPTEILNKAMTALSNMSQLVNAAYEWRALEKISDEIWPQWCFIPRWLWIKLISNQLGADYVRTLPGRQALVEIVAAGAWRYGQGIYEFDPDVLTAVAESDIPKRIPPDVLMRLPEWCIYVPTPGLKFLDDEMRGFFAQLDRGVIGDNKAQRDALHVTIHADEWLSIHPIFLDGQGVLESVTAMYNELISRNPTEASQISGDYAEMVTRDLTMVVSLILYICGDEPDISNRRHPDASPQRSAPKRTKGVTKMFPASAPKVWQVGETIGNELRADRARYDAAGGGAGYGSKKRPHTRKAHHHGHWYGKRDGERVFKLKWHKMIMVAGDRGDEDGRGEQGDGGDGDGENKK